MLGDLKDESWCSVLYLEGVENWGKTLLELNIDNGTDDSNDFADWGRSAGGLLSCGFSGIVSSAGVVGVYSF